MSYWEPERYAYLPINCVWQKEEALTDICDVHNPNLADEESMSVGGERELQIKYQQLQSPRAYLLFSGIGGVDILSYKVCTKRGIFDFDKEPKIRVSTEHTCYPHSLRKPVSACDLCNG